MRDIDIGKLLFNIDTMINTLEYDSMRSAGKMKMNASLLNELIKLRAYYDKPAVKATPLKKEVK